MLNFFFQLILKVKVNGKHENIQECILCIVYTNVLYCIVYTLVTILYTIAIRYSCIGIHISLHES